MAVPVRERVHRILGRRPAFMSLERPEGDRPPYLDQLTLTHGERPLGVYENTPGDRKDAVVVTDCGLYVYRATGWDYSSHAAMTSVLDPDQEDKHVLDELLISTTAGGLYSVPVRGGRGDQRDAWECVRFLRHVLEDRATP